MSKLFCRQLSPLSRPFLRVFGVAEGIVGCQVGSPTPIFQNGRMRLTMDDVEKLLNGVLEHCTGLITATYSLDFFQKARFLPALGSCHLACLCLSSSVLSINATVMA
uniref:Uncharacterized protein n=1 Tax=Physcomitrium patens TaxID=3218 RepID=A0A2K1IZJ1_PHYPA|nr:hypothetical protein PHYPA_022587 [Physcomitrium patens]